MSCDEIYCINCHKQIKDYPCPFCNFNINVEPKLLEEDRKADKDEL